MSFAALAWAAKQRPGNLAAKMVLLGLANYANEDGCAYPSTASLAEFGDMDHKTATTALDRLVSLGMIADSGEREGRTKQIKVYKLNLESLPETEAYQKRKPPVSSVKAPQKRGTDTVREPLPSEPTVLSVARTKPEYHRLPEDWVPAKPLPVKTQAKVDVWPPGKIGDELAKLHRWAANASNDKGKGRKLNWDIAWQNWLERADDEWRKHRPANDQPQIVTNLTRAAVARGLARAARSDIERSGSSALWGEG